MALETDFPLIYLLSTHLEDEKRKDILAQLPQRSLTSDAKEAEVIVGHIFRKQRALLELRCLKVAVESESSEDEDKGEPRAKRRKTAHGNSVRVVKLAWLTDSLEKRHPLPFDGYMVYEGIKAAHVPGPTPRPGTAPIQRRRAPAPIARSPSSSSSGALPPIPEYLKTKYSCQRRTPANPPNSTFIELLRDVRTKRRLEKDEIGVRAYSTAIASLSCYPRLLKRAEEVERLPGCSSRIAELYHNFLATGKVLEAEALKNDPQLSCMRLFDSIWGVGETTAWEFYSRGWRDIDDLVEFGWNTLSRWQQVGIKYYDEFQTPISRHEAQGIGQLVLEHANLHREGYHMVICGGYRKGKNECHDVDVMLTHPDLDATHNAIDDIVAKLEGSGLVSHILSIKADNSMRGQKPTTWKGGTKGLGAGFDTLDKAMIVWQDARGEEKSGLHRRVDIIVTPWRTKGCAVLGWSGDTTFQRDLRRYCKEELRLKFDSSGVRSREDGSRVDLEKDEETDGFAADMELAERMVFKGLGLTWRRPDERCTG
ncbi:uncharacterized protein MKZ38_001977 [Zalerion maritima]|uniref:DNA polymerase n=1 Tax=Zalerion maritima TaxID=339359 RepID=A0AAD5WST3_9PEZI|nr:uncharacterized protein MKZ38_001977 [Zalerion maritima]